MWSRGKVFLASRAVSSGIKREAKGYNCQLHIRLCLIHKPPELAHLRQPRDPSQQFDLVEHLLGVSSLPRFITYLDAMRMVRDLPPTCPSAAFPGNSNGSEIIVVNPGP